MSGRAPMALALLGVLVAATGIVAGSTVLPALARPDNSITDRLPSSLTAPALVCPGSETMLVPDGGEPVDPQGAVLISALVGSSSGPASAQLKLLGGAAGLPNQPEVALPPGSAALSSGDNLQFSNDLTPAAVKALLGDALGPAILKASPPSVGPAAPPSLAAVQSTLARTGDLRGLTATACTVPDSDSWLVGGGTGEGERLRLLLANPASTAAIVDVDVHGPDGRMAAPAGDGVVVPGGAEVPIFIDALAPGLDRVAVHVTTRSGRVRATLHDSLLRGQDPGGADDVPIAAPPAKRQVIPGVSLVNGYARSADDPTAAGSTSVRIAVPGAEEAVVRVRLLNSSGVVELPRAAVANVPAGGVVDVPISGIPSGTYAAVVDADVPVIASARVGRGGAAGTAPASEFGWAASARRLTGAGYAVLPPATRSTLSLVAAKRTAGLVVNEVLSDGTLSDPVDVEVEAGTSATVQLSAAAVAVKISDIGGAVAAAIVSTAPDARGTLISVLSFDLATASTAPASAIEDPDLGLR